MTDEHPWYRHAMLELVVARLLTWRVSQCCLN
jgi:hypothetical protein